MFKKIILLMITISFSASSFAFVINNNFQLLEACMATKVLVATRMDRGLTEEESDKTHACINFIEGFLAGQYLAGLLDGSKKLHCAFDGNSSRLEIIDTIVGFLSLSLKTPSEGEKSASYGASIALKYMWPCD